MIRLAERLNPPFYILYVLIVSRIGNKPGRYQSCPFETLSELKSFLNEYKEYFETDGRHHIWVGTVDNSGLLVYDQHNVIFAYGKLGNCIEILKQLDYRETAFSFPAPHCHIFNEHNDKYEESIFQNYDWETFPLAESDEYE